MKVAWHEVPGSEPPPNPSRRVRYDLGLPILETSALGEKATCALINACANNKPHTAPYGPVIAV